MRYQDSLMIRSQNRRELGQYSKIEQQDLRSRSLEIADFDAAGDLVSGGRPFRLVIATSSGHGGNTGFPVEFNGNTYLPTANRHWSTHAEGMQRLARAARLQVSGKTIAYVRFFDDFVAQSANNI